MQYIRLVTETEGGIRHLQGFVQFEEEEPEEAMKVMFKANQAHFEITDWSEECFSDSGGDADLEYEMGVKTTLRYL